MFEGRTGFLTGNLVLDLSILAWFLAQLIKTVANLVVNRNLDLKRMVGSGDMPSSHSSFICAATASIGQIYGWQAPLFSLAAVVALASSYLDRPVPGDLVAIGEVGLTGELRTVSQLPLRIREAQRLGFRRCVIPAHRALDDRAFGDMELLAVRNIGEAIRAALRPRE